MSTFIIEKDRGTEEFAVFPAAIVTGAMAF